MLSEIIEELLAFTIGN